MNSKGINDYIRQFTAEDREGIVKTEKFRSMLIENRERNADIEKLKSNLIAIGDRKSVEDIEKRHSMFVQSRINEYEEMISNARKHEENSKYIGEELGRAFLLVLVANERTMCEYIIDKIEKEDKELLMRCYFTALGLNDMEMSEFLTKRIHAAKLENGLDRCHYFAECIRQYNEIVQEHKY
jgi:hypothetical protein